MRLAMRWLTPRRVLGLLGLLILATCLTGCSSVYMKGTPLYKGEYSKPQAPAEDRVNLWPLAYYHDPALSVLWPLGERTEDHIAARPLFSVYKLDKEKHQYNVLWPLSQFDYDKSHYHAFPFFWGGQPGSKYMGMFPLIWYWPDDQFVAFPIFWWEFGEHATVFPLIWYNKGESFVVFPVAWYDVGESFTLFPILWIDPGDHYIVFPISWYFVGESYTLFPLLWIKPGDYYVVFPIFWHFPNKFTSLFPLYTWDSRYNGYNANFLWPLIHAKNNDKGRGWRAGPFYGDYSWDDQRYRFLMWPLAHEYTNGDQKTRVAFPLYFGQRHGNTEWDLVPPLFYRSSNPEESFVVSPLYSSYRRGNEAWRLAFPLFFQSKNAKDNTLVTPLVGRNWSATHDTWSFIPALSLFGRQGDERSLWMLGPVSHFKWGGGETGSHVFPLYFYDDNRAFLSPLYSWFGSGASRNHWFLGPLANVRTGENPRSFVFPLYYHNKTDGQFISLPYSQFDNGSSREHWFFGALAGARTGENPWNFVFPFYYYNKRDGQFISLPYSRFDYGSSRDHWFLGPLAKVRRGDNPGSFVFPLYYHDTADKMFLSLPYSRTYAREGRFDHWLLGPLAGFRTGGAHRSYIFPLYMMDSKSDTLLTPLVSTQWADGKRFVNVAGPLFHYAWGKPDSHEWHALWPFIGAKRSPTRSGFHVWPLIWRKTWGEGTYAKGGALWPLVWFNKSPTKSNSKTLFLYSTSRHVQRTRNKETGEVEEQRSRETWVFPTYWYEREEWNPPYVRPVPNKASVQQAQQQSGDSRDALRLRVSTGFWPLWHYKKTDKVVTAKSDFSLMGWLYDSRRILDTPEDGEVSTYLRRRVLWRGMHYERQDGRTSLDMFPFITHDREKETGFRKTSFAWRLFRYERGRDGSVKTDILFIPVWRGKARKSDD